MNRKIAITLFFVIIANLAFLNYVLVVKKPQIVEKSPKLNTLESKEKQYGSSLVGCENKDVTYKDEEGHTFKGYWFPAQCTKTNRPTVMLAHRHRGIGSAECKQAVRVSRECFNAFVFDMHGSDSYIANQDGSYQGGDRFRVRKETKRLYKNPILILQRLTAALDYIKSVEGADSSKIGIMGYTHGGRIALEAATMGIEGIVGAVAFHSRPRIIIDFKKAFPPENIKAKILMHHAVDNPYVEMRDIILFTDYLAEAGVDWEVVEYKDPSFSPVFYPSDEYPGFNAKEDKVIHFDQDAFQQSWNKTMDFFFEAFGEERPKENRKRATPMEPSR